jgi:putative transposase
MKRKIVLSVGEFYHIYNRGVDKKVVFCDNADYERFIFLLFLANGVVPVNIRDLRKVRKDLDKGSTFVDIERGETLVDIGAYCLMPNHFHLLIHEKTDGGITKFLHKLTTGYTMYFNKKYDRVGPLFQGTFKSEHADSDEYLKYLFSYIHLNPIKLIDPLWKENGIENVEETKSFLDKYSYSSYFDYSSNLNRKASVLLEKGNFPEYFSSVEEFMSNIKEWIIFNESSLVQSE